MEVTSKVMLLALSENEIFLLRLALLELMRDGPSRDDTISQATHLLGKLPTEPLQFYASSDGTPPK